MKTEIVHIKILDKGEFVRYKNVSKAVVNNKLQMIENKYLGKVYMNCQRETRTKGKGYRIRIDRGKDFYDSLFIHEVFVEREITPETDSIYFI